MSGVVSYLQTCYENARNSSLVRKINEGDDQITTQDLKGFESILNKAQPNFKSKNFHQQNASKRFLYELVRPYDYTNRQKNNHIKEMYIRSNPCVVLWMSTSDITNHFNFYHKVYVKWLNNVKKYEVTAFVSNKGKRYTHHPRVVKYLEEESTESSGIEVKDNNTTSEGSTVQKNRADSWAAVVKDGDEKKENTEPSLSKSDSSEDYALVDKVEEKKEDTKKEEKKQYISCPSGKKLSHMIRRKGSWADESSEHQSEEEEEE